MKRSASSRRIERAVTREGVVDDGVDPHNGAD